MVTILRLYSVVHVAMGTAKTSNLFRQCIFNLQVSACELQAFSCHDLPNEIYQEPITPAYTHKLPKLRSANVQPP